LRKRELFVTRILRGKALSVAVEFSKIRRLQSQIHWRSALISRFVGRQLRLAALGNSATASFCT